MMVDGYGGGDAVECFEKMRKKFACWKAILINTRQVQGLVKLFHCFLLVAVFAGAILISS